MEMSRLYFIFPFNDYANEANGTETERKTRNKQEHFNVTLTSGMIPHLKCTRGSITKLL